MADSTEAVVPDQVLPDYSPAVVIDRVSMRYRVKSSDRNAPDEGSAVARRVRKLLGRQPTVSIKALNELSLVVQHGEALGIVGRNGSGKSTLMNIVGGHIVPTSGTVHASSVPVALSVNAALVPDLPGEDNIILGCLAMGMSRSEVSRRFDSIVELSGLDKSIHLPMSSYSSGMSARLTFAIAASVNPDILLLDEALNTGDAQFKDRTKRRLDEIREQAGCMFLVSHSLTTINHMCNRAIWLDKGDLLMDDKPGLVTRAYALFTGHLAKNEYEQAYRIRDEARANLVATQIVDRTAGRRRVEA
ncbi:MAG: transporter ATP-binding protein [Micrococcaceae bacterium]|jgi:teichoic acid transport system ATP-binding protein|nr:transporter ATP-binding protein [Micrococcaceae bacterium]